MWLVARNGIIGNKKDFGVNEIVRVPSKSFKRWAFERAMRTRKSYITEQQAGRCSFQGDQNLARKELRNIKAASQVKCIVGRDTARVVTVTENFGGQCQCTLCRHCYQTAKSKIRRIATLFCWNTPTSMMYKQS